MPAPIRQRQVGLPEQLYVWNQFYGLDLKDAPLLIPARFARKANFIDIGLLGSVRKALGPSKINSVQITGNPKVYQLHEYRQDDGDVFFLAYTSNGKLYKIDSGGTVTEVNLQSLTLNANAHPYIRTFNGLAVIGDGTNKPIYAYRAVVEGATDVTVLKDLYQLGNDAPASNPGTAIGTSGVLNGNYYYKVTFVSDTGNESNPKQGAGSGPVNPVSQRVDLNNIPTNTDVKRNVVARRLYRTDDVTGISEAEATYYYLDEIADNTTTTYEDNTPDTSLGDRLIETNDPPPAGLVGFVEYEGSLYGFVPNTSDLRYSDVNNGEAWSPFAVEPIAPGDGDVITGLGKLNELVVFKGRSIHLWMGIPGLFRRVKKASLGCIAGHSIVNVDLPSGGDVLFFLSPYGPYYFDEQDPYPVSREIEPIFTKRDPLYQFSHAAADKAVATYNTEEKKYFLAIPVNGSTDNNLMLIYDIWAKSWHVREPFYCGALTLRRDNTEHDQVVGGESRGDATNGGFTFLVEGGDDYLGNDFTGEYITAWNHCGYPDKQKQGLYLGLDVVSQTAELLYVDIYIDGQITPHRTLTLSLDVGGDKWNESNWDQAKFASDTFLTEVVSLDQINFRQISIGFRTDIKDAPWQLLQARLRHTVLPTAGTRR